MGEGLQLQPGLSSGTKVSGLKVLIKGTFAACRGADVLRDIRHIKQPVWQRFRQKAKAY